MIHFLLTPLDHPTEAVPVKLHINRNQTATASIIFNKVYPVPECFATDYVRCLKLKRLGSKLMFSVSTLINTFRWRIACKG